MKGGEREGKRAGGEGRADEEEFEKIKFMGWNINGWRGDGKEEHHKKIRRVKGEVIHYDVFVLTETHLRDEEGDIKEFEKEFKEYHLFHVHMDGVGKSKKGVTVGVKKKRIEMSDIEIERDEGEPGERGRWIRLTLKKVLDKELDVWGIYAPVNVRERKTWMKKLQKKMEKRREKAHMAIMGDFNFVMDTKIDKRGGNSKRGMEGKKEQQDWERKLAVFDVWRQRNPRAIATTWATRGKAAAETKVKTRLDRVLVGEEIDERVTETRIDKTKVSDHDVVTWTLETRNERKKTDYERLPRDMIEDEEYQKEVRKIFEEEKDGGIEGWERFKIRCVAKGVEMRRKRKKKKGRDRNKTNRQIQKMRRILEWTENAMIQTEKGKTIKRWRRGNEMLRKSNTMRWMGKRIEEITDLEEIEIKGEAFLGELLRLREEMDGRRRKINIAIEKLKELEEDERCTKSFFAMVKPSHKKEEIFSLMEEQKDSEWDYAMTGEKREIERRDQEGRVGVATEFYKELWKKRKIDRRALKKLTGKVKRKVDEEGRRRCGAKITKEEVREIVKKLHKGKAAGIDGIPAEFYQKFDYVTD